MLIALKLGHAVNYHQNRKIYIHISYTSTRVFPLYWRLYNTENHGIFMTWDLFYHFFQLIKNSRLPIPIFKNTVIYGIWTTKNWTVAQIVCCRRVTFKIDFSSNILDIGRQRHHRHQHQRHQGNHGHRGNPENHNHHRNHGHHKCHWRRRRQTLHQEFLSNTGTHRCHWHHRRHTLHQEFFSQHGCKEQHLNHEHNRILDTTDRIEITVIREMMELWKSQTSRKSWTVST